MNMSKLTRKPLDINTLISEPGIHLKDILNLSEWLLDGREKQYKTKELAEFLIRNGVVFSKSDIKDCVTEIGRYLPPKKSIGVSLKPYINRLHALYLENFRRNQPGYLYDQATTTHDMDVLLQWVQNIRPLRTLQKTSLRNLVLFHSDKQLILDARKQAYDKVAEEIEQGIKYDESSLFANLENTPQQKLKFEHVHLDSTISESQWIDTITDVVEGNYKQIAQLQYELEQIKNLLNIRVQDLLRAVK